MCTGSCSPRIRPSAAPLTLFDNMFPSVSAHPLPVCSADAGFSLLIQTTTISQSIYKYHTFCFKPWSHVRVFLVFQPQICAPAHAQSQVEVWLSLDVESSIIIILIKTFPPLTSCVSINGFKDFADHFYRFSLSFIMLPYRIVDSIWAMYQP